jgi:hypothetical protein
MSTAVLDDPRQAVQTAVDNYTMPSVRLGQLVMFYPNANTGETNGVVAKVIGVNRDQIHVETGGTDRFPSHQLNAFPSVRHRTDPKLATSNSFVLRYGCWDYTPWEKELHERIAALETKVEKLLNDLGGPSTKSKKGE